MLVLLKQSERARFVRRSKFKMIFNFLSDEEYQEERERSDSRYSRKIKIKKHLNLQEDAH